MVIQLEDLNINATIVKYFFDANGIIAKPNSNSSAEECISSIELIPVFKNMFSSLRLNN